MQFLPEKFYSSHGPPNRFQKMASSFRLYGKFLSYSILWNERQERYLSASFHGGKLQKVLSRMNF
jgi:hypothetical protein